MQLKLNYLFFIFLVLITTLFNFAEQRRAFEVKLENLSDYKGKIQFFWDDGSGFNEVNSKSKSIRPGLNKVRFNFPIFSYPKKIRLDISEKEGIEYKLYELVISYKHKPEVFFDKESLILDQVIYKDLSYTTIGNDPKIILDKIPKKFTFFNFTYLATIFLWFVLIFASSTKFLRAHAINCYSHYFKFLFFGYLKKIFENYLSLFDKNYKFIGFLTIIFVCLLSLYPIIFFGKSIDSPMGQALLSSPGSINPTIPGFDESQSYYDGFKGNDTGAFAWAIAPNITAAIKSIKDYGEFPFYNKYVGGGVANFAMLNNLILDPLNIFIYFFNGNSWGFDLKLLFSRIIFALGIFYLSANVCKSKRTALLLSLSSLFIGYFHYRVQHPSLYTITYAPFLLFFWTELKKHFIEKTYKKWIYTFLIGIFSFFIINSGPAKESAITLLMVNLFGIVDITLSIIKSKERSKQKNFLFLTFIIFTILLFCSFNLILFLDYLSKNFSVYKNPSVTQLSLGYFLGLFQNNLLKYNAGFSSNLFFFFCFSLALANFKELIKDYYFRLSLIFFLLCFSIVYKIFPYQILLKIPFINNIFHVWDVFAIPGFIFLIILSSIAFANFNFSNPLKLKKIINMMLVIYIPFGVFFIFEEYQFFNTVNSSSITTIILTIIVLAISRLTVSSKFGLYFLFSSFFIHFFINGFHIKKTDFLDDFLTQPMSRGDYSQMSPAIDYIKSDLEKESFRVIGFHDEYPSTVLFPGFNTRYMIESIVPAEPIRNYYFDKFLDVGNFNYINDWMWLRLLTKENITKTLGLMDKLNIKYVITNNYVRLNENYFTLVFSSDYKVWLNKNYWPRAFATTNVKLYSNDNELKKLITNESRPFVFLDKNQDVKISNLIRNRNNFAENYQSTNNTLHFNLQMYEGQILVINQSFYENDYELFIDNKPCQFYKANVYQIACDIKETGYFKVKLVYKPKYAYLAGLISFGSILLYLLILIIYSFRFLKNNYWSNVSLNSLKGK
jgi:hypothetical protein